jgi:hypothetical protein
MNSPIPRKRKVETSSLAAPKRVRGDNIDRRHQRQGNASPWKSIRNRIQHLTMVSDIRDSLIDEEVQI